MAGKAAKPSSSTSTSTKTATSSFSRSEVTAPPPVTGSHMESSLRLQLLRSLTRIERHLRKRDPQGLSRIANWYSRMAASTSGGGSSESPPALSGGQRRQRDQRRRRVRRRQKQKRVEQNDISSALIKHLKIPRGIATRSLLVPPQPDWIFAENIVPPSPLTCNSNEAIAGFSWLPTSLNTNVSNAINSSRRSMEREQMKKKLERWIFLYFRVLRRNWESTVVEEKKAASDVNMYAEEHIHKWTVKLRFKIMRQVPVKVALSAFMCRLGLETNPAIVFCRDGFYGLMDVGNASGDSTKTPCAMIGFNATPRYLGLKNGDSIYVNFCSVSQRQMMEDAPRLDAPKLKYRKSQLSIYIHGDEEEGEFDNEIDSENCAKAE